MPDRRSALDDYHCVGIIPFFLLKQSKLNIVCKCVSWYVRQQNIFFPAQLIMLEYNFMFRSLNFKSTFGMPGKKTNKISKKVC